MGHGDVFSPIILFCTETCKGQNTQEDFAKQLQINPTTDHADPLNFKSRTATNLFIFPVLRHYEFSLSSLATRHFAYPIK